MIIKKAQIKNFGKLHNKTLKFQPGINLLYGPNESGKSTFYGFLQGMFYGMKRMRGKAARTDAYSRYEPWENPGVYGGQLFFQCGGRNFCLSRSFRKDQQKASLICEDDAEQLSLENGDLDMLLGNIGEAVYENTIFMKQLRSRPEQGLYGELQNYMASYQESGDVGLDLEEARRWLRKEKSRFQKQADLKKAEEQHLLEKLESRMEDRKQEVEHLYEKRRQLQQKQGLGLERRFSDEKESKGLKIALLMAVIFFFVLLAAAVAPLWGKITGAAAGIILEMLLFLLRRKRIREEQQDSLRRDQAAEKRKEVQWEIKSLDEEIKDKEERLKSLQSQYEEYAQQFTLKSVQDDEIRAIVLAEESIDRLAKRMQGGLGEKLRERTSEIFGALSGGSRRILLDRDMNLAVYEEGRELPLFQMSTGTADQIYFSFRMAVSEILCAQEPLPVILDEAFAMYDDERLTEVFKWLYGEKKQVILGTCQKREEMLLKEAGIPYWKQELK